MGADINRTVFCHQLSFITVAYVQAETESAKYVGIMQLGRTSLCVSVAFFVIWRRLLNTHQQRRGVEKPWLAPNRPKT